MSGQVLGTEATKLLWLVFLIALGVSTLLLGGWLVAMLSTPGLLFTKLDVLGLTFLVLLGPTTWTVVFSGAFLRARIPIAKPLQLLTICSAVWAVSISYICVGL